MYMLRLLSKNSFSILVHFEPTNHTSPSPGTEPQELLITHYDCEDHHQKTLLKYAINQITQCETEPQEINSTFLVATL